MGRTACQDLTRPYVCPARCGADAHDAQRLGGADGPQPAQTFRLVQARACTGDLGATLIQFDQLLDPAEEAPTTIDLESIVAEADLEATDGRPLTHPDADESARAGPANARSPNPFDAFASMSRRVYLANIEKLLHVVERLDETGNREIHQIIAIDAANS